MVYVCAAKVQLSPLIIYPSYNQCSVFTIEDSMTVIIFMLPMAVHLGQKGCVAPSSFRENVEVCLSVQSLEQVSKSVYRVSDDALVLPSLAGQNHISFKSFFNIAC